MTNDDFQILLIDDDEDEYVHVRDLFLDIKKDNYQITWKPTYSDGLNALKESRFDACLLDYRLGEYTGLDLLRDAKKFNIKCPIIFLTGQGDFDLDLKVMQMGAADYLIKDQLTPDTLERSLRYSMKHALDMDELQQSKAQILQQDRLANLGLLSSSLAHEIGTPLGIIRSRAELVGKKANHPDFVRENIEIMVTQIDKITKLVNSLLHLARGRSSPHSSVAHINHVVQDVLNLVQHELQRKSIKLQTDILGNYVVKAESGSLGQVLLNLLVNALHAIEDAKNLARPDGHLIQLTIDERGKYIRISVQDTGCGIPEENLSQLFKPFFTTKEIGRGTGLGLATSYNLVNSWDGSILARNNKDYGATFEICLLRAQ